MYKGHDGGCRVREVNEAYSTQDCLVCQARSGPKGLAQRQWRCTSCGAEHDLDHNAAKNILARGLRALEMEFAAALDSDESAANEAFGVSSAMAGAGHGALVAGITIQKDEEDVKNCFA